MGQIRIASVGQSVAFVAVVLLFSVPAARALAQGFANVAAPTNDEPCDIRVESESLNVQCAEVESGLVCEAVTIHEYSNRSENEIQLRLSLDPDELVSMPAVARVDGRLVPVSGGAIQPFTIAPGTNTTLELRRRVEVTRYPMNIALIVPPLSARHPLLGENSAEVRSVPIALDRSVSTIFRAGVGESRVRLTTPVNWPARIRAEGSPDFSSGLVTFLESDHNETPIYVDFEEVEPVLIYHGGPFIGLGGTFGRGFHARLGYEIGFDYWFIGGITLESDFHESLTVAPLLEAALPQGLVIIPSLAVGVGAPVRLLPEVRPGVRIQLSASLIASFVASFDYFPGDQAWRITLLGQVGL